MSRECSPPTMCHMSHVMCHVAHVTCHVSHVTCHASHVMCHMSGNSQGVKRPYLGHKIILCNTLLQAPGPILMAPDSFYLTNTSSGRMGIVLEGPNTVNTCWYLPPQSRQLIPQNPFIGPLAALTGEANTTEYLLYLVPQI